MYLNDELITKDHTLVNLLVSAGDLTEEEAKNIISKLSEIFRIKSIEKQKDRYPFEKWRKRILQCINC